MRLFLIGMPGSGKSFWMRQLSKHFQTSFVDLDCYIEQQTHQTIPELFAISEAYFREQENKALTQIIQTSSPKAIVATGGGTPFFYDNMNNMKRYGVVIYLKAPLAYLIQNLTNSKRVRPLLDNLSDTALQNKLAHLYEQRKELYEEADLIIDIDVAKLTTFAEQLTTHFRS